MSGASLNKYYDQLGITLGEKLLTPTRIYVKALKAVKDAGVTIKGTRHITGGGFQENIPRMLPNGIVAKVEKASYEVPAIFKLMASVGNVEESMMYNTYNMGLGMVLAVDPADADKTVAALKAAGEEAYIIGEAAAGDKGVILC
jgi:phosphoribosylformylglycinamidine cyclo-ligase